MQHDGSTLHNVTNWIGTSVSGTFLYVIAALNVVILVGIIKVFTRDAERDLRRGRSSSGTSTRAG